MALGRLDEAEARYREAIRQDMPASSVGAVRRESLHGLAFSTYGLAVVLDRAGRAGPAREMMGRALALDPRLVKLHAAEQPGGDVFFLPEGDVYYYIGLASEVAGRVDDAEAAFQEFLARQPKSRWAPRARAHITALDARSRPGRAGPPSRASGLRVVAAGTVMASGPIPAPLVDAAWRAHPRLVEDCLDDAVSRGVLAPRDSLRIALELVIDARGTVTEASVKSPPDLDAALARCAERSLRENLTVPRPQRPKDTRVRLELLVGPEPGGV
jgi:tetratricopeptide (TPR) repeat protein